MPDVEEFWEELLLAQIQAGWVIPVVGRELLTVVEGGREVPLYEALAQRLLAKYDLAGRVVPSDGDSAPDGTSITLRPYHELNDAVAALTGRLLQDLYRPVDRTNSRPRYMRTTAPSAGRSRCRSGVLERRRSAPSAAGRRDARHPRRGPANRPGSTSRTLEGPKLRPTPAETVTRGSRRLRASREVDRKGLDHTVRIRDSRRRLRSSSFITCRSIPAGARRGCSKRCASRTCSWKVQLPDSRPTETTKSSAGQWHPHPED